MSLSLDVLNGFHQGFQGFVTSNLGVNHLRTLFCVRGWKGVRGFKSAIPQRYLVSSFPTNYAKTSQNHMVSCMGMPSMFNCQEDQAGNWLSTGARPAPYITSSYGIIIYYEMYIYKYLYIYIYCNECIIQASKVLQCLRDRRCCNDFFSF